MNQQILFNDDLKYDTQQGSWVFTCLIAGERIKILIEQPLPANKIKPTDEMKFDLEQLVEDWLEHDEPNAQGEIFIPHLN